MDEPVRRRSFVRLAATDAVQNAGRLAALSGIAAGMVKQGVASLASAVDPAVDPAPSQPAAPRPTAPLAAFGASGTPAPRRASLDAAARATLASSSHLLLAVNRHQVGPFINRYPCSFQDEQVWIETRATSAMAQAIRRDPAVTVLLEEPATSQRLMIFGTARLLEGTDVTAADVAAAATTGSAATAADTAATTGSAATAADTAATTGPVATDPDRALLVIDLSHAVRTPL